MAKAYYDVSYKTYYNDRLKPVQFRGKESHPLYVRVTYDRETTSFRSYYFDLFRQKKYDLQGPTLAQIDELEGRVIDYIIARNTNRFTLDRLLSEYRLYSEDILNWFERPFLLWLAECLRAERLPDLATVVEQGTEEVLAIQLWDDLKASLRPDIVSRIEEKAFREVQLYYLLAAYVRDKFPQGPFCLPYHEWDLEEDHITTYQFALEEFLNRTFGRADTRVNIMYIRRLVHSIMSRDTWHY
jgi:hypothetical protein